MLRLRMCGGLEVVVDDRPMADASVGGRQGRLVLAYLTCERHRPVLRDELADLLWPGDLPESWSSSLSAVVSRLRRLLGEAGLDGSSALTSAAGSYQLLLPDDAEVDLEVLVASVEAAEEAVVAADPRAALDAASVAEPIASRGFLLDDCDWVDQKRSWIRTLAVRAALARSAGHALDGAHARAIEAARDALILDDTHEASYRQLMGALAGAGERAEALRVWERCRVALVDELGIDPSPETEALYLDLLGPADTPPTSEAVGGDGLPSGVVTFLLTDIVESTAMWDRHPDAMAEALERHDRLVARVIAEHGGTLLKSKLEGDATVSVFARATACATAALAVLSALDEEEWPADAAPRLRMAMHTGEAFERGGDYFGPALNRAARLRSLAGADQVLLSQAVTELVRDHLPDDVVLDDLGHRDLRGLSRGENVFQLSRGALPQDERPPSEAAEVPFVVPPLPAPLASAGPFVGRSGELAQMRTLWEDATHGSGRAVFVGGEPGVGKSRLAAELAAEAHGQGAVVLYGRCDEDLAAPLQPFVEALRAIGPALGAERVQAVRGVEELGRVVPELAELLPAEAPNRRSDPDGERLALFDAVTQVLAAAAAAAPVLLVLDDLHWAGKTTLSLLRHVLRGASSTPVLVVGTYRDTELGRSHPLAATLADLRRDGFADRLSLGGLERPAVVEYLAAVGTGNPALGRELAEVTSGNPFFLIEVVRHIDETGGSWEPGSLPEGVREATGRRLSLLSDRTNDALSVAAVAGASFDLALVEEIRGVELTEEVDEALRAGLVVEDHGSPGRFRFAHALVRQVLLAELVTLKRVRLHRAIAELLEATTGDRDLDTRLADLAYHWYECASAGDADKAVEACRRAGDRAVERLAYEEAGDLYGMALQALDEREAPDADLAAALHLARCDALLTAGDVAAARSAIDALEHVAHGSERMAAWYTTYEGLLAVLGEPDRLTEIVQSIGAAAAAMRAVGDLGGEARAHYVHASALERLGQIGAAERALDAALAAARAAGDRRLADAVLAEAPPAALWGPRPVTRASGTCLDVVRVLRVTQGAPAVEAVALRCQAVLEALRGRFDAARRMVGSARRTFDRLGLAHRQLEVELAAGFIELLAGEPEAASGSLRTAYDELRARGLDGEAAQAGAFLGRALLLLGRVDEGDAVAAEAAELAGSDLKAGVAWRTARADAAVRRGELDRARAFAEDAVAMATATDALLLVADARLTLAMVLDAAGDVDAAAAESERAVEACEAKGATAMLPHARGAARPRTETVEDGPRPVEAAPPSAPVDGETGGEGLLAMACVTEVYAALNRRDYEAYARAHAPGYGMDDRRRVVGGTPPQQASDQLPFVLAREDTRLAPPELVEGRGQCVGMFRSALVGSDFEVPILGIARVDSSNRLVANVLLEPDDPEAARAVLDEVAEVAVRGRFANDASRCMQRWMEAVNDGDLEAARQLRSDDYLFTDSRPLMASTHDSEGQDRLDRILVDGGGLFEGEALATRGRSLVLQRWHLEIPDPPTVNDVLIVCQVDEQGRNHRSTGWSPDDVDGATADLDRAFAATEAAEHTVIFERLVADAAARDASIVHLPLLSHGRALLVLRSSDRSDEWVEVVRHDGSTVLRVERVAVEELDEALLRYHDLAPPERLAPTGSSGGGTLALEVSVALQEALNRRDFDGYSALQAPGTVTHDHRKLVGSIIGMGDTEQMHYVMDGRIQNSRPVLVEARGERVGLTRWSLRGSDFEVAVLTVVRADAHGRRAEGVIFDEEDLVEARAELAAMAGRAEELRFENDSSICVQRQCDALNDGRLEAARSLRTDDFTYTDRRTLVGVDHDIEGQRVTDVVITRGGTRSTCRTLATRGRTLSLHSWSVEIPDPPSESGFLVVSQVDEEGRGVTSTGFDPEDLDAAVAELERTFATTEAADHSRILDVLTADASARGAVVVHLPLLSSDRAVLVLAPVDRRDDQWIELLTHDGTSVLRAERFPIEQFDAALLRFRDPAPSPHTGTSGSAVPAPLVVEALRTGREIINRRDWEAYSHQTITPDRLIDDRRRVVRVTIEGDDSDEMQRVMGRSGQIAPHDVLEVRGERVVLARSAISGRGFEVPFLTILRVDAHGLAREVVVLEDEIGPARTVLEEVAERARAEAFDNDATRHMVRWRDAVHAGDLDAARALRTDDYQYIDRRPLFAGTLDAQGKDITDRLLVGGGGRFDSRQLASRGRSLTLQRLALHLPDPESDSEQLLVGQVDDEGRMTWSVGFDLENLDDALEELDRRFRATESAPHDRIVERVVSDAAARDLTVVHLPLLSDHRALMVVGQVDRATEQWIEVVTLDDSSIIGTDRFAVEALDDAIARYRAGKEVARPTGRGRLAHAVSVGMRDALNRQDFDAYHAMQAPGRGVDDRRSIVGVSSAGDDTADMPFVMSAGAVLSLPVVLGARGERVTLNHWSLVAPDFEIGMLALLRVDVFGRAVERVMLDETEHEAAQLVLEAMGRRAVEEQFDNDGVHQLRRWREMINAQDIRRADELVAEGFAFDDRRPLLRARYEDEALTASNRLVIGQGWHVEATLLGTRGRSLALERWHLTDEESGGDYEILIRTRVDEQGRGLSGLGLDPEDVPGAIAELDHSYVEHEAAVHAPIVAVLFASVAARRALVEHLPIVTDDRAVAVLRAPDPAVGAWIELVHHDGAQILATDRFAIDDLDGALLRLAGLELESGENEVVNAAVRAEVRLQAGYNDHDWEAVDDVQGEGYWMDDRRSVVQMSLGADEARANARLIFDGRGSFERETVAIRGDRLVLSRWVLTLPEEQAVAPQLTLNMVDEEGRYARTVMFDVDDLDGAMAELDRLHREMGGGELDVEEPFANEAFLAVQHVADACHRRDREGLQALFVPHPRYVERRLGAATGNLGEPDNLEVIFGLLDLDDFMWRRELLGTRGERLALVRERVAFLSRDAGRSEVDALSVVELDHTGLVIGSDTFDLEQLDEAYDVLDGRFVEQGGPDLSPFRHAYDRHDWDAWTELFAPSFRFHDHRPLGWGRFVSTAPESELLPGRSAGTLDRDEFMALQREQSELIADERLSIDHVLAHAPGVDLLVGRSGGTVDGVAFDLPLISLTVFGPDGRVVESRFFALEDVDLARSYFDRVAVPGANEAWLAVLRMRDAANSRDRNGLEAVHAPGHVAEDRRTIGAPTGSGMDTSGPGFEQAFGAEEFRFDHELLDSRGDRLVLIRTTFWGRDRDLGTIELECLQVVESDGQGRLRLGIAFDPDALAEAMAELDRRAAPAGNAAWQAMLRLQQILNVRDRVSLEGALSPGYVSDDRRVGGLPRTSGPEAIMRNYGVGFELDQCRFEHELIEERADRLVLIRTLIFVQDRDSGPVEVECLQVVESDDDGRVACVIAFEPEELEAAHAELDRRHAELTG